jgi:hypothetical protein
MTEFSVEIASEAIRRLEDKRLKSDLFECLHCNFRDKMQWVQHPDGSVEKVCPNCLSEDTKLPIPVADLTMQERNYLSYESMNPKNLLLQYESLVQCHKRAEEQCLECTARMREAKEFLRKYMTARWTNNEPSRSFRSGVAT